MNDAVQAFMRAIQASVLARAAAEKVNETVQTLEESDVYDEAQLAAKLKDIAAAADEASKCYSLSAASLRLAAKAYAGNPST